MLDCVRTLESPGVPFEYTFQTKAGSLTLAAQSYSLAPLRGSLHIVSPELRNAAGEIIARFDDLDATGLKLLGGSDQVVHVRATNLKGRLVRLSNGKFDFQDYLPTQQGSSTKVPFEINIDRANVQFVDKAGSAPWSCVVTSPVVRVAGLGTDWIADATANISGIGSIETRLQNVAGDGLKMSGNTKTVQLADLSRHFLSTADGKKIAALRSADSKSILASGTFEVFVPTGKGPLINADIEVHASGLRYQKFAANTATFVGKVTTEGLEGVVDVAEGSCTANFNGSATWKKAAEVGGEVVASVPNGSSLPEWAKAFLPKDAVFQNGSFRGWISAKGTTDYHVSGDVEAQSAGISNQKIENPRLSLEAESDRIVLDVRNALLHREPLTGIVVIDPRSKAISGSASAQRIDLAEAGAAVGFKKMSGSASLSVLIDGTISKPGLEFVTHGQGVATLLKDHTISLGQFELAGRYGDGNLSLTRGIFNTPEGLVEAHGSLGNSGGLGLQVVARGVLAAAYDPRLSGEANLSAKITGTVTHPSVVGRVEGYELAFKNKSIPAVVADFNADRNGAIITDLQAARGTASLAGSGKVEFKTGNLQGSLAVRDIQVADWIGDDFVGAFDVPILTISGTLNDPIATAHVQATSLVVKGVKVDSLFADLQATEKSITINDLKVVGANGSITATGQYDIASTLGKLTAQASGISIEPLLPEANTSTIIRGKASGQATFNTKGTQLLDGDSNGTLANVNVNGTELGNGAWNVKSDGNSFNGNLNIGSLDRFVKLTNLKFEPETKRASGELSVRHFLADDIAETAVRYFPNLSFDAKDSLLAISGSLNLDCNFGGTIQDPELTVKSLEIGDLSYRKQALGDLTAVVDLKEHRWNLHSVKLSDGPAALSLFGTIDEHGETHIDSTTDNKFDLAQLSRFDSRLSRLTGTADLWFSVDGPTTSPRIVASLNLRNLFAPAGTVPLDKDEDKFLRFTLDKIVIDPTAKENPGAHIVGSYSYKGFQGEIDVAAPFEYPFTIPKDKPLSAHLTFDKSDLGNIAALLGGLDATRTTGTAEGDVTIEGTLETLTARGDVSLAADALAFSGVDDIVKSASAKLSINAKELTLEANATPIRGGHIGANATIPLQNLREMAELFQRDGNRSLLERNFTGTIKLDSVQIRQRVFSQSTVAGVVQSQIQIAGTFRRPSITGTIGLTEGDFVLKALPASTTPPEDHLIDPSFSMTLDLKDPARLRSATADMYLLGNGTLVGSLQAPILDASLIVDRGTIRLPAALLRLEQGGTVNATYGKTGTTSATAIVDMEGNTSVTASRYGDSDVQRYDITLGIKGDLLQDNGLTLSPSSDPPDLSPERILGILGSADLLTTFSNSGKEGSALQSAALSSVPMFLDPFTGQVAKGLGLDFLNLEYNAYDLASVAFGKVLGSGFSIEGSRQLSEPPPGFPLRYDIRLLYRPRRLLGAFSRIRLFVGSDQDRPWKVGLEYGFRF